MLLLFLLVAAMLWVVVPILGIFPLLFWLQIYILKKQSYGKQNRLLINTILLIVAFTVSIFSTSTTVSLDTILYIGDYVNLTFERIFNDYYPLQGNNTYGNGFEIMLLVLAYPTHFLSNGSPFWFLFNNNIIINSIFTFVISKSLSRKYYPLLLVIIFSTQAFYYQSLIMRHFLSITFFLASVALYRVNLLYILFSAFALLSHLSIFPYILVTLLFKLKTIFKNIFLFLLRLFKRRKVFKSFGKTNSSYAARGNLFRLFLLSFSIVLPLFLTATLPLHSLVLLFPSAAVEGVINRFDFYDLQSLNLSGFASNYYILLSSLAVCSGIFIKYNRFSWWNGFHLSYDQSLILEFIYFSQLPLLLFFQGEMRIRLAFIVSTSIGIFFSILLDPSSSMSKLTRPLRTITWLYSFISVFGFFRFLQIMPSSPSLNWFIVAFEGNALGKNLYDYIDFFLKGDLI